MMPFPKGDRPAGRRKGPPYWRGKGIGSVGHTWSDGRLVRWSDGRSQQSYVTRKCLAADESSSWQIKIRHCHPRLWDISILFYMNAIEIFIDESDDFGSHFSRKVGSRMDSNKDTHAFTPSSGNVRFCTNPSSFQAAKSPHGRASLLPSEPSLAWKQGIINNQALGNLLGCKLMPAYWLLETRISHQDPMRNQRWYINLQTNLLPRRWTADDIAVRADGNLIRQLAFSRQISTLYPP